MFIGLRTHTALSMPASRPERTRSFACRVDIQFHLPHVPDDRPQAPYPQRVPTYVIPDATLDLRPFVRERTVDCSEFERDFHGGE